MSLVAPSRVRVCGQQDLDADSGVAALVDGEQIAIYFLPELDPPVYALGNFDPFSNANVLSRGLLGDVEGVPVVVSPIYKQRFELSSGRCVDDADVSVPVFPLYLSGDDVWLDV